MLKRIYQFCFCLMVLLSLNSGVVLASNDSLIQQAFSAAKMGQANTLEKLLNSGVSINATDVAGDSLLIVATREGYERTAKMLLAHKPDIAHKNKVGDSALMVSVIKGYTNLAIELLQAGAPINEHGWDAFIYAGYVGNLELVNLFLKHGADVNDLAPGGSNALMFAALNGHKQIVERLLKTNINVDQKNDRGYTAETWAEKNGNTEIAQIILTERYYRAEQESQKVRKID